jgi:hypothetical protein
MWHHAVEARDSRPTGSTLYAPEHDFNVRFMCMFGRIEYFSTWGWMVGCPVVQDEAGGYSGPQTITPVENDERA